MSQHRAKHRARPSADLPAGVLIARLATTRTRPPTSGPRHAAGPVPTEPPAARAGAPVRRPARSTSLPTRSGGLAGAGGARILTARPGGAPTPAAQQPGPAVLAPPTAARVTAPAASPAEGGQPFAMARRVPLAPTEPLPVVEIPSEAARQAIARALRAARRACEAAAPAEGTGPAARRPPTTAGSALTGSAPDGTQRAATLAGPAPDERGPAAGRAAAWVRRSGPASRPALAAAAVGVLSATAVMTGASAPAGAQESGASSTSPGVRLAADARAALVGPVAPASANDLMPVEPAAVAALANRTAAAVQDAVARDLAAQQAARDAALQQAAQEAAAHKAAQEAAARKAGAEAAARTAAARTAAAERATAQQQATARRATPGGGASPAARPRTAAPAPGGAAPAAPAAAPAGDLGARALAAAMTRLGRPYVWGAAGPGAFDCSGLVLWAYAQVGRSLPHSSAAQSRLGTPVARDQLRPGDLVFFYSPVSHVGIYAGNGKVINATTSGQPVQLSDISRMPFHNARRI